MESNGLPAFVQDNESLSAPVGTVRGLHFQRAPQAQAKLVWVVSGAVFDVAVDIRPGSATFGKHVAITLDADDPAQVFVPAGFAHGFCTLKPNTLVQYKVSTYSAPTLEGGVLCNDPALGIKWPIDANAVELSDRDKSWPTLAELGRSA